MTWAVRGRSRGWRSRAATTLTACALAAGCGSGEVTAPPPAASPSPTTPSASGSPPRTATPAPTGTTAPPPARATIRIVAAPDLPPTPDAPPPAALVATRDGTLAIWDTDRGAPRRELATFDDPRDFGGGGEPFATGAFLDDVVLAGDVALVAVCCEPAVGALRAYEVGGSSRASDETIAYGDDPAVAYDGEVAVAFATGDFLALHPTVPRTLDSSGRLIDLSQLTDEPTAFTTAAELGWAPDGRHLAAMVMTDDRTPELWLLDTEADDPLVARVPPPDGRVWSTPAFLRDGTVLVAEHPADDESAPTTLTTIDLTTRTTRIIETLDVRVTRVRTDVSHTFMLLTGDDGSLRWREGAEGPDTIISSSGVLDADWR